MAAESVSTASVSVSSTPAVHSPEASMRVSSASSPFDTQSTQTPPQKSSSRVVLLVIVGVVLIAGLVVARNHNSTSNSSAGSTAPSTSTSDSQSPSSMTASPSTPSMTSSSPSATVAPSSTSSDLAPTKIVAHYTNFGATVFWAPDPNAAGLTTYNIETASSGGQFKLLATVPATQTSLDVTKSDVVGWTSFKIMAVYSDGNIVAGKVFGLPGQFS